MGRIDENPTPMINQEEQDVDLHDRAHREGEEEEEYDSVPVSTYDQHDQEINIYNNGGQYKQEQEMPNSNLQTLQQQSPHDHPSAIPQTFSPQQGGELQYPQPNPHFHSSQTFPPTHQEDEFISPHGLQPFPPQQGDELQSPGPIPPPPQQGGKFQSPQPFPTQLGGIVHSPQPQPFPPQQGGGVHSPQPQPFPPQQGGNVHSPQPFPPQQGCNVHSPQPQPFPPQQGGGVHSPQPQPFPPQQGGNVHSPQPFPPQQGCSVHSPQPQPFPPQQRGKFRSPQPQHFPPQQGGGLHSPQPFPPQQGGFNSVQSQPQHNNSPHNPHGYGQTQPQPFPPKVAVQYPPTQPQPFPPKVAVQYSPSVSYNQYHQTPMLNNVQASPMPTLATGVPQYQQFNEGWKTGLFDCLENPENALVTACFPCITFGQIAEIVDNGQTPCSTSGLLYGMLACLIAMPCIISCNYRTRLRTRYGLIESPAPDWLTHCFCECCALCQEYRELQIRGIDPSIGWLGNVAKNQQEQQQISTKAPMNQTMMG